MKYIITSIKSFLKLIGDSLPVLTAFILFQNTLSNINQILLFLAIMIYILSKIGFNINVAERLKKVTIFKINIGKVVEKILTKISVIGKVEDKYIENTGDTIIQFSKTTFDSIKNLKKEASKSKMKEFKNKVFLWLKHNKKQILGYITAILLAVEYFTDYLDFITDWGLPPDTIYYLAGAIFVFLMWVMGGEGFTGNIVNQLRENAIIAKKQANTLTKKYRTELAKVEKEIETILALRSSAGTLPPDKQERYAKLIQSKEFYKNEIDKVLAELEKKTSE